MEDYTSSLFFDDLDVLKKGLSSRNKNCSISNGDCWDCSDCTDCNCDCSDHDCNCDCIPDS